MNLFMTGAGGYIGGSVAARLQSDGHSLRGLVRSEGKGRLLAQTGIEPVVGNLDNVELLMHEARMSDGVISAASADHAPSLRAIITALEGSGKVLLHTSGSSVVGDNAKGERTSHTIFDEDIPLVVDPGKQARRDLDLEVIAASKRGVRGIVICPSLIYGIGRGLNQDSIQIPFMVRQAQEHGVVPVVGNGANIWSNVHIDDLADLYVLALHNAPAGAFYFAENGEASFAELGKAIALRLGLSRVETLPAESAAQQWGKARAYYTFGSNSRVRATRARRELGWSPKHASVIAWIRSEMPV